MRRSPFVTGIMITAIPFYIIGGFILGWTVGDRFGNRVVGVIVGLFLGIALAVYDVYAALLTDHTRGEEEGDDS